MAAWLVRTLGVLLLLSALVMAFSRAPDRPVTTLVARWALPPSDFVNVRGMAVHIRDEGPRDDPAPIVLLHGIGASLHTWEGWAQALKTGRRVVRFDLPGFGLTGPFAGDYTEDDYRTGSYARFVLDVMAALNIPRAVLAGNDMGGEVAWQVAALAPERVGALVLVGATGPPFEPHAVPLGLVLARLPLLRSIGQWVLPRTVVAQSLASLWGDPAKVTAELVERHWELALRDGNRRALSLWLRQMSLGEKAERIATLKQPTLLLWGGRDRLVPPAVGRDFQRRIAGSRLVVFDDLGHVPHEEDPARTVRAVQAFSAAVR